MLRVYELLVEVVNGQEVIDGLQFCREGVLICTIMPTVKYLIQDTTQAEHTGLVDVCIGWHNPSPDEWLMYDVLHITPVTDPDYERAKQLLATSPAVITMPQVWELLRILGKKHGFFP